MQWTFNLFQPHSKISHSTKKKRIMSEQKHMTSAVDPI